jgi:hypothetical protein
VNAPIAKPGVRLRQQPALHLRSELQVAFQGTLLVARQVVETEPDQRIGNQPFLFDGIVAGVANAVRSLIHSLDGGIHFLEKLNKPSFVWGFHSRN